MGADDQVWSISKGQACNTWVSTTQPHWSSGSCTDHEQAFKKCTTDSMCQLWFQDSFRWCDQCIPAGRQVLGRWRVGGMVNSWTGCSVRCPSWSSLAAAESGQTVLWPGSQSTCLVWWCFSHPSAHQMAQVGIRWMPVRAVGWERSSWPA